MTLSRFGALLLTSPLTIVLALIAWVSLAFTGWGTEADPVDQLTRDLGPLLVSAFFGTCAAWVVTRVLGASRWWSLVGTVPALLVASAYFTGAY